MYTQTIGIDTCKATLTCTLLRLGSSDPEWDMVISNDRAGLKRLLDRTPEGTPWVIEPTGRYSLPAVLEARAAGQLVLMAPPRKVKAHNQSIQSRAKTDLLDSVGIASYGLSPQAKLREYPLKSAEQDMFDQILSARRGLVRARVQLSLQASALVIAAEVLEPAIASLDAHIADCDKRLKLALKEKTPAAGLACRLMDVPGVGLLTASAAAQRLAARNFERPEQFVAYIGLDVRVSDSGTRRGQRVLTKQGDPELRRLFFLAARSNVRCKESPFKRQYEREIAKGLSPTAACNAVARKIAGVCWSMAKNGTKYDAGRVGVHPSALKAAAGAAEAEAPAQNAGETSADPAAGYNPPACAEDRATLGSDPSADAGAVYAESGAADVAPDAHTPNTPWDRTNAINPHPTPYNSPIHGESPAGP